MARIARYPWWFPRLADAHCVGPAPSGQGPRSAACGLHAVLPNREGIVILDGAEDKAVGPKTSRALRDAGRWLLAWIESFPIPNEEALWGEDSRRPVADARAAAWGKKINP